MSMEMHEAFEALHRSDEELEETMHPIIVSNSDKEGDPHQDAESNASASTSASDGELEIINDAGAALTTPPANRPSSPRRSSLTSPSPQTQPTVLPPIVAPPPQVPFREPWTAYYMCGGGTVADPRSTKEVTVEPAPPCAEPVKIREGEPLQCRQCGCRMLYKMRTKRMVQFEAR
ncbi:hypothetical protein CC86DRAFT_408803 [Ophiobolus disseminans]|uniref:Uncharacterized protein n=1 Tax=Ophiobolus disseminans TaxID=1469910 RepID=A0A6A6ZRT6_9PLEO|nr:hypothetical protein CC86DRAFT_408803 [Ophiobolus disseminans]